MNWFSQLCSAAAYGKYAAVHCRVHQPVRQCLGWLLLQSGQLDEAWKVYSQVSSAVILWLAWQGNSSVDRLMSLHLYVLHMATQNANKAQLLNVPLKSVVTCCDVSTR